MNLESSKKTIKKADTFDVIVEQLDNEKTRATTKFHKFF